VEYGKIEKMIISKKEKRRRKQSFITPIFTPTIVSFIYIRPVDFISVGKKLIPLGACMEYVQNVVKDFKQRNL